MITYLSSHIKTFQSTPCSHNFPKNPKIFSDINTFLIYEVFVLILNVPPRTDEMFDKINKFETKSFYCELNIMIVIYVFMFYTVSTYTITLNMVAIHVVVSLFFGWKNPFSTLQCFVLNGLWILYHSN